MPSDAPTKPLSAAAAALSLRQIHRAASELRRGIPVVLRGETPLVLLAAETGGPDGIAELRELGVGDPVLLLAPVRAAAALRRAVDTAGEVIAVRLPEALLDPDSLRSLADPTAPRLRAVEALEPVPAPAAGLAALNLVKLARLLPAVLAVTAHPDIAVAAARRQLVSV